WISSLTNSPAWVDAALPWRLSALARSIVSFSGIGSPPHSRTFLLGRSYRLTTVGRAQPRDRTIAAEWYAPCSPRRGRRPGRWFLSLPTFARPRSGAASADATGRRMSPRSARHAQRQGVELDALVRQPGRRDGNPIADQAGHRLQ